MVTYLNSFAINSLHRRTQWPTRCSAIFVCCSVRDWTRFCYVIGFENIRIHRPHVIGFVTDLFFRTLESGFRHIQIRWRIRRMRVDGSRIGKEKNVDSKVYVWTGLNFHVPAGLA